MFQQDAKNEKQQINETPIRDQSTQQGSPIFTDKKQDNQSQFLRNSQNQQQQQQYQQQNQSQQQVNPTQNPAQISSSNHRVYHQTYTTTTQPQQVSYYHQSSHQQSSQQQQQQQEQQQQSYVINNSQQFVSRIEQSNNDDAYEQCAEGDNIEVEVDEQGQTFTKRTYVQQNALLIPVQQKQLYQVAQIVDQTYYEVQDAQDQYQQYEEQVHYQPPQRETIIKETVKEVPIYVEGNQQEIDNYELISKVETQQNEIQYLNRIITQHREKNTVLTKQYSELQNDYEKLKSNQQVKFIEKIVEKPVFTEKIITIEKPVHIEHHRDNRQELYQMAANFDSLSEKYQKLIELARKEGVHLPDESRTIVVKQQEFSQYHRGNYVPPPKDSVTYSDHKRQAESKITSSQQHTSQFTSSYQQYPIQSQYQQTSQQQQQSSQQQKTSVYNSQYQTSTRVSQAINAPRQFESNRKNTENYQIQDSQQYQYQGQNYSQQLRNSQTQQQSQQPIQQLDQSQQQQNQIENNATLRYSNFNNIGMQESAKKSQQIVQQLTGEQFEEQKSGDYQGQDVSSQAQPQTQKQPPKQYKQFG